MGWLRQHLKKKHQREPKFIRNLNQNRYQCHVCLDEHKDRRLLKKHILEQHSEAEVLHHYQKSLLGFVGPYFMDRTRREVLRSIEQNRWQPYIIGILKVRSKIATVGFNYKQQVYPDDQSYEAETRRAINKK